MYKQEANFVIFINDYSIVISINYAIKSSLKKKYYNKNAKKENHQNYKIDSLVMYKHDKIYYVIKPKSIISTLLQIVSIKLKRPM